MRERRIHPTLQQYRMSPILLSAPRAILAVAGWITCTANIPVILAFLKAPDGGSGLTQAVFVASGWIVGFSLLAAVLALLCTLLSRRATKFLLILFVLAAAPLGYFSLFYGMRFERTMFASLIQTHPAEAFELIGVRLILWLAIVGIIPAIALWRLQISAPNGWWRAGAAKMFTAAALLALIVAVVYPQYQRFASAGRSHAIGFEQMAPINFLIASISHFRQLRAGAQVVAPRGRDAHLTQILPKKRLVVLVLGETARAQNQSLNGYARETNPRMRAENVIYFPSTESCGTVTTVSVPCIFSGLGRAQYSDSKARAQENLLDMMKHAKARVIWFDNDGDCKGVCKSAEVEDFNNATHAKYCRNGESGECLDEIMLDGLEQKLANPERDTLLVLHIKGSHGPAYFKRYPPQFAVFQPVCQSNELSACSREELVNAYDNTILYTDHILGEVIALLRRMSTQYTTAMFYVSDHGESLGENGLYLHGAPYAIAPDAQTRVPMLAWLSPEYVSAHNWDRACLQTLPRANKTHDNIFSTLLAMMAIGTQEYDASLDLFRPCQRK